MVNKTCLLVFMLAFAGFVHAADAPRVRPSEWAQPVIATSLDNAFRVDAGVFRSEQPGVGDLADLKALGLRSLLSLREYHTDSERFAQAGFVLLQHRSSAGSLTAADAEAILLLIRDAPKPVLVHCWHGSDRTGLAIAAYRLVFQDWTKDRAVDELVNGGFGFHASIYPEIVQLVRSLDVPALKAAVLQPPPGTSAP